MVQRYEENVLCSDSRKCMNTEISVELLDRIKSFLEAQSSNEDAAALLQEIESLSEDPLRKKLKERSEKQRQEYYEKEKQRQQRR